MRNTKRLQRLLQDVLDSAKVDNKNQAMKKTQFDLNSLLKEACADAQNQARGREISTVFEPAGEAQVVADPARVSQVIYNLLDNALKFTARGTITVCEKRRQKSRSSDQRRRERHRRRRSAQALWQVCHGV